MVINYDKGHVQLAFQLPHPIYLSGYALQMSAKSSLTINNPEAWTVAVTVSKE